MAPALLLALAMADPAPIRFLALGDSYTVGEGVPAEQAWPRRLAEALRGEGATVALEVVAKTGWTSGELAEAMTWQTFRPPYDLVSLGIGVNDQYRGLPLDEYRRCFAGLLERAIALAGGRPGRVLVLSIPDWGVSPFAIASGRDPARVAAEIDAFNAIARATAEQRGASFVDLTELSRALGAAALTGDRLHPSGGQYAAWVEQRILPAARRALAPSLQAAPQSPP